MNPPVWLTINGAADYAGISRNTIYRLINEGRVRTTTAGRRRLVATQSLRDLDKSAPGRPAPTG